MIKCIPFVNLFVLAVPLLLFLNNSRFEPVYLVGSAFFGIAACFLYIICRLDKSINNDLKISSLFICCYELIAFIIELSVAFYFIMTHYRYA